jgi:hypothetical protein
VHYFTGYERRLGYDLADKLRVIEQTSSRRGSGRYSGSSYYHTFFYHTPYITLALIREPCDQVLVLEASVGPITVPPIINDRKPGIVPAYELKERVSTLIHDYAGLSSTGNVANNDSRIGDLYLVACEVFKLHNYYVRIPKDTPVHRDYLRETKPILLARGRPEGPHLR